MFKADAITVLRGGQRAKAKSYQMSSKYCNLTLNSHLLYSANTGGTINLWLSWMSNCVVKLPGIGKGKSGGWGCIWWIFPKKAFIFPAFATKPIVVKYEEIDLTGSKPWQPVGYWKNMSLCREEVVGRVQVYRVINIKQQVQVLKEEKNSSTLKICIQVKDKSFS